MRRISFSSESLAAWEALLRPLLARLPPALAVRVLSRGRRSFHSLFVCQPPSPIPAPESLGRTLWGIRFRSPLLNAAGMFKNGEGYPVMAAQGAGGYLAGTTTRRPRAGNRKAGVTLPFASYPRSGAASNWLGLPNDGHEVVAERLSGIERRPGCPIGASAAACPDPDLGEEEKLDGLVKGMELYDRAGVDFLEMNESCPNTEEGSADLRSRLERVAEGFLARRQRSLPVIVKLSCDTDPEQVAELVGLLVELGFDGVNFGNTSIDYGRHRPRIAAVETACYDYFTTTFGGGVSGLPLKGRSLVLSTGAVEHLRSHPTEREFHVVRTGGIEDAEELSRSEDAGISLNQWYSGYFSAFGRDGHGLYRELYRRLQGRS